MKIFLSGIQPSGALHLGNYFGAMQPAIDLQSQGQAVYFIADYHALTSVSKPEDLRRYTFDVAAGFLACGLDPARTILFRQSDVPQVHELAWLLSVVTPLGLLERAHSYKDKVAQGAEMNHGLFAYPVLMAADILLYHADAVPVGKDQKQHLEIARDIAQKFNDRYGAVFKIPEPLIREATAIVPGIDGRKMSKSYNNTLELFGEAKALEKKIMSIPTDSTPVADPKPVDGSTLALLMKTVGTPAQHEAYIAKMRAGGCGYGDLKKELAAVTKEFLAPFQEKYRHYQSAPAEVEAILDDGAKRARAIAMPVLNKVREATGLGHGR
jgi:tryptophanyl-tRNA synthetase